MATLLWTQKQDIGPTAQHSFDMVYDAARSRVVGFGGQIGETLARDTWEGDGENWTQVADTGPLPRAFHAITYDSKRERILLFGGVTEKQETFLGNRTCEWSDF